MLEQGVVITLTLFVAGVVYQSGRLSARVDHLEKSNQEIKTTIEGFFRRIEHMTVRKRDA